MNRATRRAFGALLLIAGLVLVGLAFTRFERTTPPQPGSPAYTEFQAHRMAETRLSVLLGLVASFTLLGSFALLSKPADESAARSGPTSRRP